MDIKHPSNPVNTGLGWLSALSDFHGVFSIFGSGDFDEIDCQIEGLGRIDAVEQLYVAHTQAAIDSIAK